MADDAPIDYFHLSLQRLATAFAAKLVANQQNPLELSQLAPPLTSSNQRIDNHAEIVDYTNKPGDTPRDKSRQCRLCHVFITDRKPLSAVMNHAKRHSGVKQFQCAFCAYR